MRRILPKIYMRFVGTLEIGAYFWKEISGKRSFGSTIARDDDPAYQSGSFGNSHASARLPRFQQLRTTATRAESFACSEFWLTFTRRNHRSVCASAFTIRFGKFRLKTVTDAPPENITDLVEQEREMLAQIFQNLGDEMRKFTCSTKNIAPPC